MNKKFLNDFGWIAPDGTFYKCDSWQHGEYAQKHFNKDEFDLENEGWIKITVGPPTGRGIYSKHMYITPHQYTTLKNHGFDESDLEDECIFPLE